MQQETKKIKIFLMGGHLTPALAVIEEIRSHYPAWELFFVGRKWAMEGDRQPSEEYRIIRRLKLPFLPLTTGRLQRSFSRYTLTSLGKIPGGLVQADRYCRQFQPDLIVSFGGYLAVPIVLSAWLRRIPILTHEQTRVTGLANRLISLLANKVCLSYRDSGMETAKAKIVVTGLPIREVIFRPPKKIVGNFQENLPLLYITGGITGAASLNEIIYGAARKLLNEYLIIHQVGRQNFARGKNYRQQIEPRLRKRYLVLPYLDGASHAEVLQRAAIVIGRAGANLVGELAAVGKVAILVPLLWSGGGEQLANANWLAGAGSAVVLAQKNLTSDQLVKAVRQIFSGYNELAKSAAKLAQVFPRDGAKRLVEEMAALCGST